MDTKPADKLIDVLNKELAIYKDILKISRNKSDIIVKGRVSDLESITKLEQTMIFQLGRLEGERERLVEELAGGMGIKADEITLSGLEEVLPEEQKEKLSRCRKQFSNTIKNLRDANALNSRLIKNSLDYIDFSINLLTYAGAAGNNYENSGQSKDGDRKNFFDMKL